MSILYFIPPKIYVIASRRSIRAIVALNHGFWSRDAMLVGVL